MPRNFYKGWTLDELLTERKALQQRLTTGQLSEVSAAGVRTAYDHSGANASAEQNLLRVEYALWLMEPDNFTNPYTEIQTRTRPVFFTSEYNDA